MSDPLAATIEELLQANRILLHNQVLDAFGHVSVRHPEKPDRYLLSSALAPVQVTAADIMEFDLDSNPVKSTDKTLYLERFIHGSIYRARPDINAICHHHAQSVMPFCVSSKPLRAVTQTGASMGEEVATWDSRDHFGDTNLLISSQKQADNVATTLARSWTILLRGHGVVVAAQGVRELVFRSIFMCQDAAVQLDAQVLGSVKALNSGELALAGRLRQNGIDRCWEHWSSLLPPAPYS